MSGQTQYPPPRPLPVLSSSTQPAPHFNPFQDVDSSYTASHSNHISRPTVSSQHSNPFRTPKHSPHSSAESQISTQFIHSPISPIEEALSQAQQQFPAKNYPGSQPTRMSEPRRSVDLRKLNGQPYPGHEEADARPRKVKVAQDMYAGEMPPGYATQTPLDTIEGHASSCQKCGGHKREASDATSATIPPRQVQNIDCQTCGGKRSMPPSSFPRTAVNSARAQSSTGPRMSPVQNNEAGPSGHKHKCTKCGRRKRLESISSDNSQPAQAIRNVPQLQTNGIPIVGISIEPPTTTTEYAPVLPRNPATISQERQMMQQSEQNPYQKEHKPSRSGSISSMFRSLSRRKKSGDGSLPSQQLAHGSDHTSNNMGGNNTSKLKIDDPIRRPGSPFSFVDKPQEDQTFEMDDMRKSKQPQRRNSWDKTDESTQFLSSTERPEYRRSQSTSSKLQDTPQQPDDDIYLALPTDQRPGITRFKSLRLGVNKAANGLSRSASQIGRSTSLRRLESVKKVPEFWYRNDMAIEGASSEYDHYAY